MCARRKKKRRRPSRREHRHPSESFQPGGGTVLAVWGIVLLHLAATYYSYRSQMNQQNYAHLSVAWLVMGVVMLAIAIGITVQWRGSKAGNAKKDKHH